MKRRLFCLILSLLMLVPMFASCGKEKTDEEIVEASSRKAVTLSMYVITEDETTDAAAQAVEDAINKLIKSKYTTKLDITFLTADEYYGKVEAQIEGMKANAGKTKPSVGTDTVDSSTEAATTEATVINEYGVKELRYPDLTESQIDIIMIDNYDKYVEYAGKGWLYALNETLKNTSMKLGDYIYPSIINAASIDGTTYAIPNNRPIGDSCTYMVVNRELAEEFGLDLSRVYSMYDCADFFAWVKENKQGVTPISGDYDKLNVAYLNVDSANRAFTSDFSLVGTYGNVKVNGVKSLFADANYRADLLSYAKLRFEGYFGNGENFAAKIKTGSFNDVLADAENYEIVVLEGNGETKEQLCSSMFAVVRYTESFNRAMEVITYLNINPEFRNLLQYGVENVNYSVDFSTGLLTRLNHDYMMDLYKTGNVFMAYPEEGMPYYIWEIAKKLNLASGKTVVDDFGGFKIPDDAAAVAGDDENPGTEAVKVDFESSKALAKASAELKAALNAAKTYEEYAELVNGAAEKYADVIKGFLDTTKANSPYTLYVSAGN